MLAWTKWLNGLVIVMIMMLITAALMLRSHYLLISIAVIVLSMVPFFARFELRKVIAEEIVLISMLAAIAAVSRVPFAGIPSVQPTSFVIIMTGLAFGAECGFLVGSVAALVSNIFLGQGPWTPWQMFGWGMMGFSAGLVKDWIWMNRRPGWLVFGALWGLLFGWLMNLWGLFGFFSELNWTLFLASYAASLPHDLAHAASNMFFLAVFGPVWLKILNRVKVKYRLLEST